MPGTDIEDALARLDTWLSSSAEGRAVLEGLRPPATDADLDLLRAEIQPYPLPREVEVLLRWHNGEDPRAPPPHLLPVNDGGPLLGAAEIAAARHWLLENLEVWQWNPLWLPVLKHRWQQVAVVMAEPAVVLHNDFGNPHLSILSSSLSALLWATVDIASAGLLTELPHRECKAIVQKRADEFGWDDWPYPLQLQNDENAANWPEAWRSERGLPPL